MDNEPLREGHTCRICWMTSYHPTDIYERYCGNCHHWCDEYDEDRLDPRHEEEE